MPTKVGGATDRVVAGAAGAADPTRPTVNIPRLAPSGALAKLEPARFSPVAAGIWPEGPRPEEPPTGPAGEDDRPAP